MSRPCIAILGASFDPPHFGHAAMAITALDAGEADAVWLCPSPGRWDKTQSAPSETRVSWAKIMSKSMRNLGFNIEICLEELTFNAFRGSWFFLHHLSRSHPTLEFRLLVGEDSWKTIPQWRDPVVGQCNGERILRDFPILVVPRKLPGAQASGSIHHLPPSPELQIAPPHRLLPSLDSQRPRWRALFGCEEIASLSSSTIRDSLQKRGTPGRFCFLELEEEVQRSGVYLNQSIRSPVD